MAFAQAGAAIAALLWAAYVFEAVLVGEVQRSWGAPGAVLAWKLVASVANWFLACGQHCSSTAVC